MSAALESWCEPAARMTDTTPAHLHHGDCIDIAGAWITVMDARPAPGLPTVTRVVGTRDPRSEDPDDIVILRIGTDTRIRKATQ